MRSRRSTFTTSLFQPGPQPRLTRPERAAALEASDQPIAESFDVQFEHVVTMPSRRDKQSLALCASDGLPAWRDFQRCLGRAAVQASALRRIPRNAARLTLAYDKGRLGPVAGEPIRWTVRSFARVHSHVGDVVHEPPRQWELHGIEGDR